MNGPRGLILAMLFAPLAAQADAEAGKTLFQRRCSNCHAVGPNAHSGFGPQLNDLFGRRAGGLSGYRYSAAMQQADFAWDRQILAAFLRDPDKVVPDTKMRFWGIGDAEALGYIADFLESQRHADR